MSPEQLEGKEADARSDIFAFGAVLYEMLTGKRAFAGESAASIIAAIMHTDPASAPEVAGPVEPVLRRCLAKEPDDRWQTAADLKWALEHLRKQERVQVSRKPKLGWLPWAIATLAVAAAALVLFRGNGKHTEESVIQFAIQAPENTAILPPAADGSVVISPDGRYVVFNTFTRGFNAFTRGNTRIFQTWIRSMDSLDARVLVKEPSQNFVWSPDSRSLAYQSGGKVHQVDVASGRTVTIVDDDQGYAPSAWSREGILLLSRTAGGPLHKVAETGGAPGPATKLDAARGDLLHNQATFLQDGRHFLYTTLSSSQAEPMIVLASLDDPSPKTITAGRSPVYFRSRKDGRSYLIYSRKREIVAQPFDPKRMELTGEPSRLAQTQNVTRSRLTSVSDTGVFVTISGAGSDLSQPTWIDRSGGARPAGPEGIFRQPRFMADDKTVLIEKKDGESGLGDLWMLDADRGALSRLLGEREWWEYTPIWSPDNSEIIYATNKNNRLTLVRRRMRDGVETPVYSSAGSAFPTDWSPDGKYILFEAEGRVWILNIPETGPGKAVRMTASESDERNARFSPDGKWVAFTSAESGREEIQIVPFDPLRPISSGKIAVSQQGGSEPVWRKDGKEIFYLAKDGMMMAVPVTSQPPIQVGKPKPLFDAGGVTSMSSYDVTRDGQRFLVNRKVGEGKPGYILVIANWEALLRHSSVNR
jgi:Tol biopolymer transport system component